VNDSYNRPIRLHSKSKAAYSACVRVVGSLLLLLLGREEFNNVTKQRRRRRRCLLEVGLVGSIHKISEP
jgi:hypothetical protein